MAQGVRKSYVGFFSQNGYQSGDYTVDLVAHSGQRGGTLVGVVLIEDQTFLKRLTAVDQTLMYTFQSNSGEVLDIFFRTVDPFSGKCELQASGPVAGLTS